MNTVAAIPFAPLVSFILLIAFSKRLPWLFASLLSVGSVFISAAFTFFSITQLSQNGTIEVVLWHWFSVGSEIINFGFKFDALSAVMASVVSGVGALIHLFAAAYMKEDPSFSRFMAYMNLFLVAMLILVLADNLVLLYLGWEGVGLCSFLLIGFWYQEKANVLAARKAFIVTRVGDTAMAIGLFLLFSELGSLHIETLTQLATNQWTVGSETAFWIAMLLLGGAVGKSAQLPLQTWLPDAMAGPTPVSALIHAATMVTAGVYLIARMQGVFLLAPEVMTLVAWVGGLTLLIAGISALAQQDIKRILAYSTMSQIGYMMLALGAGAWHAGIFHLMTHAFFKALLFLTAGYIIYALNHQQNIYKMGALFKRMPFLSGIFLLGIMALVAFPGTSGFVSKEAIIGHLWSSNTAGPVFWWMAVIGAFITSVYSFRLIFIAFTGEAKSNSSLHMPEATNTLVMKTALIALLILSLVGGLLPIDLSSFFNVAVTTNANEPRWLHAVAIALPLVGIVVAYWLYKPSKSQYKEVAVGWQSFAKNGLGFDELYRYVLVNPFLVLAKVNRQDVIDWLIGRISDLAVLWNDILKSGQNGNLRWYAAAFGLGSAVLLAILVILYSRQGVLS